MAATTLALLQMAAMALCLTATPVAARPGQTIADSSDPQEMIRSEHQQLSETHEGGEVPVQLVYDDVEDGQRPTREVVGEAVEGLKEDVRESKLLSIEEREKDENAAYGLNIQSRSKAEHREDSTNEEEKETEKEDEELMKPFVYNIQPLSYYSTETKEQENIINYINRIKEMRENQIKWEAAKKDEARPAEKQQDAVVTEAQTPEGPIRRRIQHVQIVLGPVAQGPMGARERPQAYGYGSVPQNFFYPAPSDGPYGRPYSQPGPFFYQQPAPGQDQIPQMDYRTPSPQGYQPTVVYVPNVFNPQQPPATSAATKGYLDYANPNYWFHHYFPIVVNNPFDAMHMALSSIVEYGPEADVCRSKAARRVDDAAADDDPETGRKFGIGAGLKKGDGEWPKLARVKVRRGGVAIAGPGGIATAGSGGTAIVGPGGTAYTTRDGTAVVGPGGRVVHVPRFPLYANGLDDKEFEPPAGAETVAEGPVVYLDDGESTSS